MSGGVVFFMLTLCFFEYKACYRSNANLFLSMLLIFFLYDLFAISNLVPRKQHMLTLTRYREGQGGVWDLRHLLLCSFLIEFSGKFI